MLTNGRAAARRPFCEGLAVATYNTSSHYASDSNLRPDESTAASPQSGFMPANLITLGLLLGLGHDNFSNSVGVVGAAVSGGYALCKRERS